MGSTHFFSPLHKKTLLNDGLVTEMNSLVDQINKVNFGGIEGNSTALELLYLLGSLEEYIKTAKDELEVKIPGITEDYLQLLAESKKKREKEAKVMQEYNSKKDVETNTEENIDDWEAWKREELALEKESDSEIDSGVASREHEDTTNSSEEENKSYWWNSGSYA